MASTHYGPHLRISLRATRHVFRARVPIIGSDFLAIEREARALLAEALAKPQARGGATRRRDGTARNVIVRAKEATSTEG